VKEFDLGARPGSADACPIVGAGETDIARMP
jgi:hypothetical protein